MTTLAASSNRPFSLDPRSSSIIIVGESMHTYEIQRVQRDALNDSW